MIWHDGMYIAFDLETSGVLSEYALQPWRVAQKKAWITSLATVHRRSDGLTTVGGGLSPTKQDLIGLLEHAIAHGLRVVGWNTVFDIAWLLAYGLEDLVMQVKWLDGMLLWRHFAVEPEYDMNRPARKSFGLKSCVRELWPDEAGYEEGIDFHDETPEARERLHEYNIRDTAFTLRAAKHWWGRLTDRQQRAALIEAECLPLAAAANLRGIPVDTLVAHELEQHLANTAQDKIDLLAPLGVTEKIVRSPIQLSGLLFDNWGLPVVKTNTSVTSGKVSRSTDKEVLHELALGYAGHPPDPRVKCLREYREALNNKTKFATAPLESAAYNEDGCTHPQWMVFSTYSGRFTCSSKQGKGVNDTRQTGFALHQEKRDKMYRAILVPPQGYTIVEFDASGQEFRWMAVASGDTTMLGLCEPGEDAHTFMGASIKGWDYHETLARHKVGNEPEVSGPHGIRMMGKLANLSLQYRTSSKKLCAIARVDYNIPMLIHEAEHVHKTYRQTYLAVPVYWNRQIDDTKRLNYVETLAGRRVQMLDAWTGTNSWAMGSTAINYRIQGTGADQKYLAIAALKSYAREAGARFAWDLHDGLYWFVPDDRARAFAARGKAILDSLPYKKAWGFEPPIGMPWDCKTGPSWGQLKEFKP